MAKIHCWANGGPGEVQPNGVTTYKNKGYVAYFHVASQTGSASCQFGLLPRDLRRLARLCEQLADTCELRNADANPQSVIRNPQSDGES